MGQVCFGLFRHLSLACLVVGKANMYLGWAALFYCGAPCAFHIIVLPNSSESGICILICVYVVA